MQRSIFEPEHDQFRESARRFFQSEIGPNGERWREQGFVDREAFLKAGQQGFLLMWADPKYGGAGVRDFRFEQILIEENSRHGEGGFFMTLHSRLVAPYIDGLGTEEQKERLLARLADPSKHWKYNPGDVDERQLWVPYMDAYQAVLDRCSTEYAPWYVIPADRKWHRDWLLSNLITETLREMDPQYPPADFVVETEIERLKAA